MHLVVETNMIVDDGVLRYWPCCVAPCFAADRHSSFREVILRLVPGARRTWLSRASGG